MRASGSLLPHPGMNIVGNDLGLQPVKIADAGAAGKRQESKDGQQGNLVSRTAAV